MATSKRPDVLVRSGIDPLDAHAARVAALDALARRDRASCDLQRKLIGKGYDAAVVEDVIERLRHEKLIDDRRYLENFVGLHAARGQGPVRVRAELRKLGMQGDEVEDHVQAYGDWIEQLHRARQKKFGMQPPTDYADRQRQARFLQYRGYTGSQIRVALGFDFDLDVDTDNI